MPGTRQSQGKAPVDLVHHRGESTAGAYGHTLQMVDVATGWSERVVIIGRGYRAMEAGFEHILTRLPFPVQELHRDLGSEFFNQHMVRYWKGKVGGVQLSRSRPYQKNDNRIVEQKNDTLVRQYFGHLRLDTPEQLEAMNALYERMWLYYNLFQPVMHLTEKTVVDDQVRRKWDQAQTPEDQLLLQVQGVIAEYERAKFLERSRRGKRHTAEVWRVGILCNAPYGYRSVCEQAGRRGRSPL